MSEVSDPLNFLGGRNMYTNIFSEQQLPEASKYTCLDLNTLSNCKLIQRGKSYDGSMIYFVLTYVGGAGFVSYMGQSKRGSKRIEEHKKRENMPIDHWFFIPVPEHLLDEVEQFYIQKYAPVLNYRNNPFFMRDNGSYTMSTSEASKEYLKKRINILNIARAVQKGERPPTKTKLFEIEHLENKGVSISLFPENLLPEDDYLKDHNFWIQNLLR